MPTLKRQLELLSSAHDDDKRVVVRSPTMTFLGVVALAIGTACATGFAFGHDLGGWLGAWGTGLAFGVIVAIPGWLYVTRTWLAVGPEGLHVMNPWNQAWIPWTAIQSAEGAGVALKIATAEWSVSVWAIEKPNLNRLSGRLSTAEGFAAYIEKRAAQAKNSASVSGDIPPVASKTWGTSWRMFVTYIIVACALLPLYYAHRGVL